MKNNHMIIQDPISSIHNSIVNSIYSPKSAVSLEEKYLTSSQASVISEIDEIEAKF